jgi:DNA repair protein RadC
MPSQEDVEITSRLKECGGLLAIRVLDIPKDLSGSCLNLIE